MTMKKLTFNEFCHKYCDGLYDPKFGLESQCAGYIRLRQMVIEDITPASLDEITRWETKPTQEELFSTPDIKYLRFLHPLLRPYIIEHWLMIKNLEL